MKPDRQALAVLVCLAALVGCSDLTSERDEAHDDDPTEVEQLSLSTAAFEAAGIAVRPVGRRTLVPTIQVTGTLSYDERRMTKAL